VNGYYFELRLLHLVSDIPFAHTFFLGAADVKGKGGTKLKTTLRAVKATRAGAAKGAGTFKAKLKNGQMKFAYKVKNALGLNLPIPTNQHGLIRTITGTNDPIVRTVPGSCAFAVLGGGSNGAMIEMHGIEADLELKATKKQAKFKLKK
jgi:hypothetical protein